MPLRPAEPWAEPECASLVLGIHCPSPQSIADVLKENQTKHTSLSGFLLSVKGAEFSVLGSPRGTLSLGWDGTTPLWPHPRVAWPRCPVPHKWALRLWRVQTMLSLTGQVSSLPLVAGFLYFICAAKLEKKKKNQF